ncbi:uncharacterized protein LOC111372890, partial [Olea europaea var. sylvestris]|uniref:uncharacterized protein LOC111372890 n=1 Tax=Olea europaea var. sylvestris TaxID=158386 RepID=UPI000C1CE47C
MEHEPVAIGEAGSQRVNFGFRFGVSDAQQVRDSDTDYGDSDELKSIQSEDECTTSRNRAFNDAFNVRTVMEDPEFRIGLVFESKAILKAAITAHSVKKNREIKYKKDDAYRLRAICKGDFPWLLYATKEHNKTSFVIKTFIEEHTCPMVYRNFRVSSTYLADRYLSDWRAEPNVSVSTFMERVKKDGLVEGYVGEFRRLYICLGALRDGFIRGCRRLIGLDGCFLKTEHGGQLLSAVGVDANNGMYPVAYAVVEVENRDNWRWFLGLLKDDLHINNSQHWTFISDKQKGLVNAIESLFENSEHRTCVRHIYNNFSASHKGLALKNCLWDAARATTVLQWVHHMQRMLDIDQGAYEWLESKPASHWSKSHFREGNKCDMLLNNLCESFN